MKSVLLLTRRSFAHQRISVFVLFFGAVLFFFASAAAAAAKPSVAESLQETFVGVAEKAKPAVVNILAIREQEYKVITPYSFFFGDPGDFFDRFHGRRPRGRTYRQRTEGVGSGFLIDAEGHVVTNEHVIHDADEIRVTLTRADGREETLIGKVVGRDSNLS